MSDAEYIETFGKQMTELEGRVLGLQRLTQSYQQAAAIVSNLTDILGVKDPGQIVPAVKALQRKRKQ